VTSLTACTEATSSALILGLVPGIQPPRVRAVKGLIAESPDRPCEDHQAPDIPRPACRMDPRITSGDGMTDQVAAPRPSQTDSTPCQTDSGNAAKPFKSDSFPASSPRRTSAVQRPEPATDPTPARRARVGCRRFGAANPPPAPPPGAPGPARGSGRSALRTRQPLHRQARPALRMASGVRRCDRFTGSIAPLRGPRLTNVRKMPHSPRKESVAL
jgi:hypothetical protein